MGRNNLGIAAVFLLAFLMMSVSPAKAEPAFTVDISPNAVSTGQNVSFTIRVNNTGSETIHNISIPLSSLNPSGKIISAYCNPARFAETMITGTGLNVLICSRSGGVGLPPLVAQDIQIEFSTAPLSKPIPDDVTISVYAYNFTQDYSQETDSVEVENAASLSTTLSSPLPPRVIVGQNGIFANFTVINNGDAAANAVVPNSSIDAPYAAIALEISPNPPYTINGGGSRIVQSRFDIPISSSSGSLNLRFNATGHDANSLLATTTQATSTSTVYLRPTLQIYSITPNVTFLSANPGYKTAQLSVLVGVLGSAATTSEANITGFSLKIVSGTGADQSSSYTAPIRTDSITSIQAGTNVTLTFELAANNPSEGPKFANISIDYTDGIAGISPNQTTFNNETVFTVDNTNPAISITSVTSSSGIGSFKQGETLTISSAVSDALSGITAPNCAVLVGGISAGSLPFFSNSCNGTIQVPQDASIYGSETLSLQISDSVGNQGAGTRAITVYTLVVNTTDALTGADIKDGPDLSNATVNATNSSGSQPFSCTPLYGTKSHLCGVPLGTVVNISATSPAYIRNNNTTDSSRICVGTGTLTSCAAALPAGGFASITTPLTPNTKITILNQFNQSILYGNVTVKDSAATPWYKSFMDGGQYDHNSTVNGIVVAPIDTGKHTSPFQIRVNLDSPLNPGYLAATSSNYIPSQETQANLNVTANFTMFVRLFTEFGAPVNTTSGTVSFVHSTGTFPCVQNPADYSEYGCLVPTLSENSSLSSGGNVTIEKPGYVTKRVEGVVPPADTSAAQVQRTETLQFNLVARVTDEFGLANLTTSEVSRVSLVSRNCTYNSGSWGCPAVSGDEVGITVEPLSSSGYLRKVSTTVPFVNYVQSVVYIPLDYSLKIVARDELGSYLNATNISAVRFLFGAGVACTRNENTSAWGCPVAPGTAASPVHVNASTGSGRLNYVLASQTVPANTSTSQIVNYSANNFTIKVLPLSEMGLALPAGGLFVNWGGQNPCVQSGSQWYCPANASASTNVSSGAVGFINYLNSSVSSPALTGNQISLNTSNKYSILVNALDEFGTPRNFTGGSISFGAFPCVNSASRPYEWGCPATAGTVSQASVSYPGYLNYTSASYTAPAQTASQVAINSANIFTLRVIAYDELGYAFASGGISSGAINCYQIGGQPTNYYFCPLVPPEANITISKTGFVSSTIPVSSLNYTAQQTLTVNGTDRPKYSAVLTVRRSPSSSDEAAMVNVAFYNSTTLGSVSYSRRVQNKYYFTLPEGNQSLWVLQNAYIPKMHNFTTSAQAQYVGEPVLDYPLKVVLTSETGAGIESANLSLNTTGTFIESNTVSEYYSSLGDGAYAVTASKSGFVTSSPQVVSIQTGTGSNQTVLQLSLLYTLKVVSNDWAGAALNGTTISVTGQNAVTNPSSSNTAYFAVDPATYPVVNVTVSKSYYNTVSSTSNSISSSSQRVVTTSHGRQIYGAASNWQFNGGISNAILRLYSNGREVASCITTSSGSCYFLSTNGASGSSDFNSTEIPSGANISFSAEKSDYWTAYSPNYTYSLQGSGGQSLNSVRIGIPPRVLVQKGWNTSAPVEGATVILSVGATQIASNSTDSDGYAVFLPNYSASSSGSDFFISGTEASSGANISAQISKLGYATNQTSFSFSPDSNFTTGVLLSDNVAPQISLNFSGNGGTAYVGFENFNISLFSDELYPQDSSGVNYSASSYRISWLNGTAVRDAASLASCSGYWCNLTDLNGWDLPVGSLNFIVNVTDGQGNYNTTNASFVSAPGLNETFVTIDKSTASSAGDDFFLVTWGLVVKGTQGKLRATNLYPLNCSACATFPISGWANLLYTDVASCYGTTRQAVVRNTFPAGQTPATFCDYEFSTQYAREQNVSLKILVPTGLANARYNASYLWTALQQDLPRANVSLTFVNSSNSTPETGTNFTVTVRAYVDASSGTADDILISLNSTIGSLVYPANQTISQIYSGQYGEINFTITASQTTLGPETLTATIVSATDANSGWPAIVTVPVLSTAVTVVDWTAPFIIQGTNAVNYYNYSTATIPFNLFASDNFRLNYTVIYGNWSSGWGAKAINSSPVNNSWWNTTLSLSDGHYVWGGFANDTTGNYNRTVNRTFTVDTVAPSSAITSPANETSTTDNTPTISGTASDATSGVRNVWITSDGGSTWYLASGTTSWSYTFGTLADNYYIIQSKAEDWAGNNQSAYGNVYLIVDTEAPVGYLGNSPADYANLSSSSVQFDYKASDNLNLSWVCYYVNESGSWITGGCSIGASNDTWENRTDTMSDGSYRWGVFANDSAGNYNWTENRTFTVDTVAPASTISSPANTTNTTDSTPDISGTASDATSGVRYVWIREDAGAWALATGTTSWTYTASSLSEGTHVIQSMSEDWAGNNQSSYGEVYITVDTVDPFSSFTTANMTNFSTSTPSVSGTASDATSGVRYVWLTSDGGSTWNLTSGTASWSYTFDPLAEGTYLLWVNAEDWAGNNQSGYDEIYITVDTTAPLALLGTSPTDTFNSSSASVTFDLLGIDNLFLHSTAIYGNWSGSWAPAAVNSTPFNGSWWNQSLSLPDGYFTWGAYANDSSGNGNWSENRTFTVDTIAPAYSSLGENTTEINVSLGEVASLYSLWTDATIGLGSAILSTNETGAYANYTILPLSGQASWSNFTWTNTTPLSDGTAVEWIIWANDTLGNWNVTAATIITVRA